MPSDRIIVEMLGPACMDPYICPRIPPARYRAPPLINTLMNLFWFKNTGHDLIGTARRRLVNWSVWISMIQRSS